LQHYFQSLNQLVDEAFLLLTNDSATMERLLRRSVQGSDRCSAFFSQRRSEAVDAQQRERSSILSSCRFWAMRFARQPAHIHATFTLSS
jgi:hypothetical protein